MGNSDLPIMPGDRVFVFDPSLFRDDISTPVEFTFRPAIVISRYGYRSTFNTWWIYPDCLDVRFDHRPDDVSHGHFTDCVLLHPIEVSK